MKGASRSAGLLIRLVGAGVLPAVGWGWPHLQSRAGSRRVSGEARSLTGRPVSGEARSLTGRPGAPAFGPASGTEASQRRAIGAVARR